VGRNNFKLAGIPGTFKAAAARRREQSDQLKKQSFWIIRRSDELIIKAHDIVDRTRQRLRIVTGSPAPSPLSPQEAWGEKLIISAHENPKRRGDD